MTNAFPFVVIVLMLAAALGAQAQTAQTLTIGPKWTGMTISADHPNYKNITVVANSCKLRVVEQSDDKIVLACDARDLTQ